MEGRHRDRFVDYETLVPFDSGGKGRRVFPSMMQATGGISKYVGRRLFGSWLAWAVELKRRLQEH